MSRSVHKTTPNSLVRVTGKNHASKRLADCRIYITINIWKAGLRRVPGKSEGQTCDDPIGLQDSFQLFEKFLGIKAGRIRIAHRGIQNNNLVAPFRKPDVISKITDENAGSAIRHNALVFITIKTSAGLNHGSAVFYRIDAENAFGTQKRCRRNAATITEEQDFTGFVDQA